ncbi:hypothetical protein ElyMa_001512700 [Elysia marginata]|uniref:Uncharacterized protein n=1 Tax=Elysia marginata TaxID=1093978 RepID=A0AAV4J735_9GAST|nr:hypothetical protein ElyMa_001512700 [Elysia marginata]
MSINGSKASNRDTTRCVSYKLRSSPTSRQCSRATALPKHTPVKSSSPTSVDTKSALWPSGKPLAQRPGGPSSIPGRVKPRTLKLVLVADPPGVWHYGFSAKSGRPGVKIM